MRPANAAVVLGAVVGVFSIAGIYLAVTFLPGPLQALVPMLLLAMPIGMLWPRWFDRRPAAGLGVRALRRLAVIAGATPVAAIVAFVVILAVPGYGAWADNVHRESLAREGKAPDEIERVVADHHQQPIDYLIGGAIITAVPGTIATLVTTGLSAIVFRRRPARP